MGRKNKTEKQQRKLASRIILRIVFSVILAFVITFLSVFIPDKVSRPADLESMHFGKPVAFMEQRYPGVINEYLYPLYAFPQAFCLWDNTEINIANFFISFAINFAVIAFIVFLVFILRRNKNRKKISANEQSD